MKIKINGEVKTIEKFNEEVFLEVLLENLGYKPQLVVVELNGEIINSKFWISTKIKNGDSLEVVTIVGGGSYS
jgi:sulfur carrier protein